MRWKNNQPRDTVKHKCPKCNNKKAWKPRGLLNPTYKFRCTKCRYKE